MNENENLQPVEKLTPFTRMVMSIGTLPSSFYASMSYYESMVWLYEYLKNQVIPTVNNNGDAVIELQEKFLELNQDETDFKTYINGKVDELETYMNNYFTNLDVQQEINNKLDAMATDGTLTNLIKAYVDPIYAAFETEINNEIALINTKVDNATSGSPLVASSTSEMTNTDRVYVNTTDGNWYYYDGDSWEIGGVYQTSGISDNSITFNKLNTDITKVFNQSYISKTLHQSQNTGFIGSDGVIVEHASFIHYKIDVLPGESYYYIDSTRGDACVYVITDENDNVLEYLSSGAANLTRYEGFVNIPAGARYLYLNSGSTFNYFTMFAKRNNIILDKEKPLKNNYVLGYVNSDGLITTSHNIQSIVNVIPILLNKGDRIYSSHQFILAKYNSDGTFVSRSNYNYYPSTITETAYYRLVVYNYDNVPLISNFNVESTTSDYLGNSLIINRKTKEAKYMHISFDDVHSCLEDITSNASTYNSIFDNDFLADLKDLHDQYGAVFTLNTFNTNSGTNYDISEVTNKFRIEFDNNSNWLKFSFHAEDSSSNYSTDTDAILTSYNKFVSAVQSFATYNCIDTFARLGFFTGNSYNINKLKEANNKIQGLFTADDSRNSYYLNSTQATYVKNNIISYDKSKNLYLINSKTRLENVSSLSDLELTDYNKSYISEIFTHEYEWNSSLKNLLASLLHQANQLNYQYVYFEEILHLINELPE